MFNIHKHIAFHKQKRKKKKLKSIKNSKIKKNLKKLNFFYLCFLSLHRTPFIEIRIGHSVPQSKKLTFMYLANDVIQNSKKKGPEYGKEFGKVLKNAFTHIGETCQNDEKTLGSLSRILKIWDDRGVYESKIIEEYRISLTKLSDSSSSNTIDKSNISSKRKVDSIENGRDASKKLKLTSSSSSSSKEHAGKRETIEINGTVETHVILSPKAPAGMFNSNFYVYY